MSSAARTSSMLATLMLVHGALARAQTPPSEPLSTWAVGASAGLWGRLALGPSDEKTANPAVDVSVERRISRSNDRGRAIRVQMGWGRGVGPGFEYTRVMIGTLRHLSSSRDHSGLEYTVYLAAGGGAHVVTPVANATAGLVIARRSRSQGTRPSAFGSIGADAWVFGTRRAALRGEYQFYSVGRRIYGSMNLGVQLHFR